MIDCSIMNFGCRGGFGDRALTYILAAGGQMSRSSYPYIDNQRVCKFNSINVAAKISNVVHVNTIKLGLESGPVIVNVESSSFAFKHYSGGIFTEFCDENNDNHAVTAVGWGRIGHSEYWIIRNSWGSTIWGESGYMRVLIDGKCKILFDSYPIIA